MRLLAVTKTVPAERIKEAILLGCKDFGENRVQEAESKRAALMTELSGTTQHLIGQLQSNKARRAIELFDVIQSVDRPKLAVALDRIAAETGKKQRCLVEVKVSTESTKSGVPLAEAAGFIEGFSAYKNLRLEGLMTIGRLDARPEETRVSFRELAVFFRKYISLFGPSPILSMGMSDDFEIAIEEGSTMVRLGRALFGERKPWAVSQELTV